MILFRQLFFILGETKMSDIAQKIDMALAEIFNRKTDREKIIEAIIDLPILDDKKKLSLIKTTLTLNERQTKKFLNFINILPMIDKLLHEKV